MKQSALGFAGSRADRLAARKTLFITILSSLAALAVFAAALAWVQFATPDLPDNDGYYHIKLAALMGEQGLKPDFPWLPLTILNSREFSDHHYLFHIALIPFTLGDLRLGAKWASVLFASLAFLAIWALLRQQKIPYSTLWAFGLLAVSEAFLYRMSIARAQSLSLAFLALALLALLNSRFWLLLPLSFLYVWLYDAFPLIAALTGAHLLAVLILERRLEWRGVAFAAVGAGLGLLINPYFPDNVVFLYRHLLPKLAESTAVRVGSEWYPYTTGQLLQNSPLALLAFLAGAFGLGLHERRMDVRTATAFFLAGIFGLMLFQSRRFIEYFPPFALIFAAFAWAPVIAARQEKVRPSDNDRQARSAWRAGLLLAIFLVGGLWLSLPAARRSLQGSKPYTLFAGASAWLAANTPAGERVFQTDWDDFPRLFYYNTHNTYLVGLDPTYLQLDDPDLYDRWVELTQGRVEQPSTEIRERFGARYVVSDLQHDDFLRQAAQDPEMREVYRDDNAVVFELPP